MATLFGTVYAFLSFRARARRELHTTLRAVLCKGEALTPDLVECLGRPRAADLRRGGFVPVVGVATASAGQLIDQPDVMRPLVAAAIFPMALCVVYVLSWWLRRGP